MLRFLFLLLFACLASISMAQSPSADVNDLRPQWMRFEEGKYELVKTGEDPGDVVYFEIETTRFRASHLSINSSKPFFLFINGQVAGEFTGAHLFKMDSLTAAFQASLLMVSIYQRNINPLDLNTSVITSLRVAEVEASAIPLKPATFFRDFVILAGLMIMILLLLVVRINPKLASDYFSVAKIFSLREVEDVQSSTRLGGTSNIPFYLICSLLLGFFMMIVIHHLPGEYELPLYFRGTTFGSSLLLWLKFSLVIMGVFLVRIIMIYGLTRLFGLRGLARIHFFNWVRVLLVVSGVISTILFIYFISRGQNAHVFVVFMSLMIGILTAWVIIVFLKLSGKTEHAMFHLFSYICATEIIPLLITFKVLFH